MTLVYLGIGWFCGVWLASLLGGPWQTWLGGAGLGLVGALLLRRQPQAIGLLLGVVALGLGGARYVTAVPTIDANHVAYYNDSRDVTLLGVVAEEPDVRDRSVNLRVRVDRLTLANGVTRAVEGLVLVRAPRFPVIPYGARLELRGALETPPSDEAFNYRAYLARQGVHSLMGMPQIVVLAEQTGHPFYHAILNFKQRAHATIKQILPDPQAALLAGILLGNDNGMPPELVEAFRTTGMTHIIAISGFNIAILIAILVGLSQPFLGRRGAVSAALVGIVLYTILVGADASVVRAAIMGSVFLLSQRILGRPTFGYAALFLAGLIMTLINPFTLWDVGFQLSFGATLGLMLYAEPFTRWTREQLARLLSQELVERIMGLLTEAVIITLAAQVLTLPLMMGYFKQLSLISLVANALILPAQPGVMIWGGLATLLGLVAPAAGQVVGWIAWLFLSYTITLVRLFAAVPGATTAVALSPVGVVAIFALIGGATWLAKQPPARRALLWRGLRQNLSQRAALGGSLALTLLLGSWSLAQPDGKLHVVFIDVGQGDATFIQTPSGRQILVDGGFYPTVLNDQLGRQMPFWDREIDLLIATHPDGDHVAGLVDVFAQYRVGQLLTNGDGLGESEIYDALLLVAAETNTPVRPLVAGEQILIGDGVRLEVLHPAAEQTVEDRNENSVAMRLVYGDFTFLFTGDGETLAEQQMLASGRPLEAVVYKAGHHGARASSSPAFLAAAQPQIIVISAGADNKFGHPHPEVLQRAQDSGAAVLRTDELGTFAVISDGRTMWWETRP
jgi:competence protein ComEC